MARPPSLKPYRESGRNRWVLRVPGKLTDSGKVKRENVLPEPHRRRTSNTIERVNQEPKRRTRVAPLFPNKASLLRLVTALLGETSTSGSPQKFTSKIYLTDPPQA